jgi:hypothetical protein
MYSDGLVRRTNETARAHEKNGYAGSRLLVDALGEGAAHPFHLRQIVDAGKVNFQQLRSLREAIRRNFNLSEVAEALFTSQPDVSRQARELEDELGVAIVERHGKRLTGLTAP